METFEDQSWFWDDLEDETECSPCYFDVGNHGQDPSLASYQDKWSYWEGLSGSCGDPACQLSHFDVQGQGFSVSLVSSGERTHNMVVETAVGPSGDTQVNNKAGEQRVSGVACSAGGPWAAALRDPRFL